MSNVKYAGPNPKLEGITPPYQADESILKKLEALIDAAQEITTPIDPPAAFEGKNNREKTITNP